MSDVDASITFDATVIDNRSIGSNGVVVGNAYISIHVHSSSGPTASYHLNTAEGPQEADWDRYRIRLVDLNPVPGAGIIFSRGAYVATIEISLLGLL